MALVVDASALVYAVVGTAPAAVTLRRRLAGEACHAPHLIDAEVGNVLRRHVLRGQLADSDAEDLLAAGALLIDHRHDMTGPLARAAWHRRATMSFYDGLYAALASALPAPLLTADERLCAAPGLGCAVERIDVG